MSPFEHRYRITHYQGWHPFRFLFVFGVGAFCGAGLYDLYTTPHEHPPPRAVGAATHPIPTPPAILGHPCVRQPLTLADHPCAQ